ncbi:Mediator of RNA polymerase II transcription subunit 19 [Ophiocordyceps camponoti-floridani]|uniref:Mediator of RNA polymerase II transcription subunit 19 n=1 Tax=Ophiocordyceps camponoti-floridani TaxID=2030778 RepID=A0A8H4QCF5_9HYPO|nr:Mediator of RNA polymerase II transcription subunit 19 [Ophiocordyceps camponoti-floridani]
MSVHPQTPQSPCRFSPATSSDSAVMGLSSLATLPTPAHSVNGANAQPDDSPHKRKRALDDLAGPRKKMHLENDRMGIEDLHLDVGPKYLLCQTVYPESLPRTSSDLYQMFGLTALAAEVAREKPNGEKNALRKTYKGHIKRLGVAGHFDVHKKSEDAPSEFMAMIEVPELEWNVHQVKGRDITHGLSDATHSNLARAVTLSRGSLPKSVWDSSVLGDLALTATDAPKSLSAKPTAPSTPLASTPNAAGRSKPQLPVAAGPDVARPRRNNKKRSYGDSSFEGYGEGYPDDDAGVDTGYSTGEGEGGQKRRKKSSGSSPNYSSMRQQSYGPGMVGA